MTDSPAPRGALVLVATPIGNLGDLSPRAVEVLRDADVIAAEDTRRTRALLTHAGVPAAGRLRAIHAHNERAGAQTVVDAVSSGQARRIRHRRGHARRVGSRRTARARVPRRRTCGGGGARARARCSPRSCSRACRPTDSCSRGSCPGAARRRERIAALVGERRTAVLFEAPSRVLATLSDLLAACGPLREVAVARELTKMFEEVWRGELSEAVGNVGAKEPRGEYVIVLGPAPEPPAASDDEVDAHVQAALAEGLSTRDAAARVARDLRVPRRRVYDTATRLRQAMKPQK